MKAKTKVFLTVKCRNLKNPHLQRSRFDQTLGSASWMLQENKKPVIHANGSVTTATVWGRIFGSRKSKDDISKITLNLLKRASAFADIEDYSVDLEFKAVTRSEDEFTLAPVLFSDD